MKKYTYAGVGSIVDEERGASSVGSAFASNQVYTTTHPTYVQISERISERLAEITQREAVRKASARKAVLTVALEPDDLARLVVTYPEFNVLNYAMSRPGHAYWVASRRMANEWLAMQVNQQTDSFVHLGGSALSHILAADRDVHIEVDPTNVVAMHEQHSVGVDALRVFGDYVQVGKDFSSQVPRLEYEAYLRGERYRSCVKGAGCIHRAEGLCVDGVVNALPPLQVATSMMQMGAEVAYGFIIYHPVMMVTSEGLIPGTGIYFSKTDTEIRFKYPEGVAGVTSYPLVTWSAWLTSHYFSVGPVVDKYCYQLELLKSRDAFLFYRMVKVDFIPQQQTVTHAMELRNAQDSYVVYSWRLRDLAVDATQSTSWQPDNFVADKRVVDRTYQFGMQAPSEGFSQYAIRKQLKITNDRSVLEGTSVTVSAPLTPQQLDSLSVAVFARCFVDRYDTGRLSKLMMDELKKFQEFTSYGYASRVAAIGVYCLWAAWDWTLGSVVDMVRNMCDTVRRLLGSILEERPISFTLAPKYASFSSVTSEWKKTFHGLTPAGVAAHVVNAVEVTHLLGGYVAAASRDTVSRLVGVATHLDARLLTSVVARYAGSKVGFPVMRVYTDDLQTSMAAALADYAVDEVRGDVERTLRTLNEFDEEPVGRHVMEMQSVVRQDDQSVLSRPDYEHDPDPVHTLNDVYAKAMPGIQLQNLEYDTASISLDPQDRTLAAPYLKIPRYFGEVPTSRPYYVSKVRALNVPKRQGTTQELLSAIAARNLSAPQIAKPQDDSVIIPDIWNTFLDKACVPEARAKLWDYQGDPVALGEDAYRDWMAQATPESISAVRRELKEASDSLAEMDVSEYLVMLKSDVKPTMSTKPLTTRTEPQVIVYHKKPLSSLYSSIFRVLVRRFLSLLKPNYHVNLLKSVEDIRNWVQGVHPFHKSMKYVENDFSKYDKSQSAFAFALEEYIFRQLGMNEELLRKWLQGHVDCRLRSVATGLSLHVMYQRKSGDSTTAFGNVILNIVSVTYAYAATQVVWAVFMGDDSLICASVLGVGDSPVQSLAEIFNLSAKSYITDSPYFASTFFEIDDANEHVSLLPDPIKRIEKLSMHVAADNPQWEDRFRSFKETVAPYRWRLNTSGLARHVAERYENIAQEEAARLPSALATVAESFTNFRSLWTRETQVSLY